MTFKLAAHNWMRPEPLEITLQRLARLGYSGLEIMAEPARYDPAEVRPLLEKNGIECWGGVSIMLASRDLIHGDRYIRIGAIEYLKDSITLVKELGGQVMTIVPSEVGKVVAMSDPEVEWKWAVEGLKRVADHARSCGVRIALEPLNRFETNFLNRHDQALTLAEHVGDDIGVCLDAFHINIEESDPLQALRNTGSKLFDFHIADTNRRAPGEPLAEPNPGTTTSSRRRLQGSETAGVPSRSLQGNLRPTGLRGVRSLRPILNGSARDSGRN